MLYDGAEPGPQSDIPTSLTRRNAHDRRHHERKAARPTAITLPSRTTSLVGADGAAPGVRHGTISRPLGRLTAALVHFSTGFPAVNIDGRCRSLTGWKTRPRGRRDALRL